MSSISKLQEHKVMVIRSLVYFDISLMVIRSLTANLREQKKEKKTEIKKEIVEVLQQASDPR